MGAEQYPCAWAGVAVPSLEGTAGQFAELPILASPTSPNGGGRRGGAGLQDVRRFV